MSGGQRQRIGIARALYKQANVLIFDEATSALDNETEQAVMNAIDDLGEEITILIIAHRLTTLKGCDKIIKLEKDFPENSLNIDRKNPRRLIRAYELGKNNIVRAPKSKNPSNLFKLYGLTLNRKDLYLRIDKRIDIMIDEGWVEEVKKLVDQGCEPNSNSFSSIGYREIYSYIMGITNLEESI